MTLNTRLLTPAILYLPLHRLTRSIKIHSLEGHGVRRATIEGLDALSLIHVEGIAEERSVIVVIKSSDTLRAIQLTADVAGVVHHRIVLERSDSHLLDLIHGKVHIRPVLPIIGVTVVLDLIDLVVRTRGIIHQHDELATKVSTDEALIEGLRRIGLGRDRLAVLILQRIGEGSGRDAEVEAQQAVDLLQTVLLALAKLSE